MTKWALATVLLAIALAARAPAAATTRTETPKTLDALKADQLQLINEQWQRYPELPPMPIAEILRIRVIKGMLFADSPLYRQTEIDHRIDVNGQKNVAHLRVIPRKEEPTIFVMAFDDYDFSDPDIAYRYISVIEAPIKLVIADSMEYVDRNQVVTLDSSADPGAVAPVAMRIQIVPFSDDVSPVGLLLTAPDLWSLRRDHPVEVERYLRPMFRGLEQEQAVFAVDDKTAWQVMSDTWQPPPGLHDRVIELVGRLKSGDYATRAAAQKDLETVAEPAALDLLLHPLTDLTAEQSARIQRFVLPYHPLTDAQVVSFRKDLNFLLDCLFSDDDLLRASTLEHLNRAVGRDVNLDAGRFAADRAAEIWRLRDELTPR